MRNTNRKLNSARKYSPINLTTLQRAIQHRCDRYKNGCANPVITLMPLILSGLFRTVYTRAKHLGTQGFRPNNSGDTHSPLHQRLKTRDPPNTASILIAENKADQSRIRQKNLRVLTREDRITIMIFYAIDSHLHKKAIHDPSKP